MKFPDQWCYMAELVRAMNHSSCTVHDVLELVNLIFQEGKKEGVVVVDPGRYQCMEGYAKSLGGQKGCEVQYILSFPGHIQNYTSGKGVWTGINSVNNRYVFAALDSKDQVSH